MRYFASDIDCFCLSLSISEIFIERESQGVRGQWIVNYTGTQSFINTLSYSLVQKLWVLIGSNF